MGIIDSLPSWNDGAAKKMRGAGGTVPCATATRATRNDSATSRATPRASRQRPSKVAASAGAFGPRVER